MENETTIALIAQHEDIMNTILYNAGAEPISTGAESYEELLAEVTDFIAKLKAVGLELETIE